MGSSDKLQREERKILETEYNEEEVLKIVAEDARREGEKIGKEIGADMLATLLKKLTPGSDEFDRALNETQEEREALYEKYGIS